MNHIVKYEFLQDWAVCMIMTYFHLFHYSVEYNLVFITLVLCTPPFGVRNI